MFGQYFWSFVVAVICLGTSNVYATIGSEEIASMKAAMEPIVMECIEEFGITDEQVKAFKSHKDDADVNPCFVGCFFKKTGLLDGDGMYDADKALELTKPHVKNEDDLAILDSIRTDCAKVNDEDVSDGDKGCERAMLLFNCFKEHKDEIDLDP